MKDTFKPYDEWNAWDILLYAGWVMGVLMIEWLRLMFGRKCIQCGQRKPLFTQYCDKCWDHYHA